MSEKGTTLPVKRILYIGLFIVPFLIAMALIFWAKGLGTLPIMDEQGKFVQLKYKNPPSYYTVPEFQLQGFDGDTISFAHSDSVLYLVTFFPQSNPTEWGKHLLYIGDKILKRANNVRVIGIYENDTALANWEEDPRAYVKSKSELWDLGHANPEQFAQLMQDFKVPFNDSIGLPEYVLVDKDEHIRAFCAINDAKVARDVPKMFKLLSNQYVPRKLDIKQVKTKQ